MLRKISLILSLFLFFSITILVQNSPAQEVKRSGGFARLQALGNNPYVTDPFYTTLNPAYQSVYYDFLWGDLGGTKTPFGNDGVGQFAGFNFKVADNLILGGLLSRNDLNGLSISSLNLTNNLINQLNTSVGGNAVIPLNNNLEALGTFNLGKFSIGVGVSYASSTNESTPDGGKTSTGSGSQFGINAGILTHTNLLKLDAGVSFISSSASFDPGNGKETSFSGTSLLVNAKLFYKLSQKIDLVPTAYFITQTGSSEIPVGDKTESNDLPSTTVIMVGAGINYKTGDILIAGGPALAIYSVTTPEVKNVSPELSTSSMYFPIWNLGVEWDIAEWLVGRLGYTAITGKTTTETAASATKKNETIQTIFGPSGANAGLGFKIGKLSIDATVNVDVLRQGLANIGNANAGPTFGYLSASFAF